MSGVSVATLVAALLFVSFHVPGPVAKGKQAKLVGVAYHLALLPAVATLPAPAWARAAGYAWMLLDAVFDGAAFAGLDQAIVGSLRQAVHIIAALWVAAAAQAGGVGLMLAGFALALVFVIRSLMAGFEVHSPAWIRHLNAVLNVIWWIAVAVTLR